MFAIKAVGPHRDALNNLCLPEVLLMGTYSLCFMEKKAKSYVSWASLIFQKIFPDAVST